MHDRLRLTHAKTEDEVQLELLAPWYAHIVTTDNGTETFNWPDGGTAPFRGEKNTNWEGGYRVPWRFPFLIDLHANPFDRASGESGGYERWSIDRAYALVPAQAIVGKFLQTYSPHGRSRRVLA